MDSLSLSEAEGERERESDFGFNATKSNELTTDAISIAGSISVGAFNVENVRWISEN